MQYLGIFSTDRPQVGNRSEEGMFKFVVIISYYKIEFLPQLFVRTGIGEGREGCELHLCELI